MAGTIYFSGAITAEHIGARGEPAASRRLYRPAAAKRCSTIISGDAGVELIEYEGVEEAMPRLLESIRKWGRLPARLP